jgi:hypothetical protein
MAPGDGYPDLPGGFDRDQTMLTVLECLRLLQEADTVERVLEALTGAACAATGSPRGMAGLSDGRSASAHRWYDIDRGWTDTRMSWEMGEGGPGRVCQSGTALVCNDLPATAEGLSEATETLELACFACVPLADELGSPLGFLEVGNKRDGYAPDDVRVLNQLARHAVMRLQTITSGDRECLEERLRAETCLSARGLFSLDPDEVLREAAARMAATAAGAAAVAVPVQFDRLRESAGLDHQEMELAETAIAEGRARIDTLKTANDETVSRAAVPLITDGRAVGVVVLRSDEPFAVWQLSLMDMLAERAAVALEHATLYQTQREIARQLQEQLLPTDAPQVDGLEIGVFYRSAGEGIERGGDFIDFYSLTDHQLVVAIGDVSGKGVEAMAITVMAKYALRAIVATLPWPTRPGEALRDVQNALHGQIDPEHFLTLQIGELDVKQGLFSVSSAGHPVPFIVRKDAVERPLLVGVPAIGVQGVAEIDACPVERVTLEPGDAVLLFTDGIAELRDADGRFYEEARMGEALDAIGYAAGPPADDVALILLRYRPMI